MIISLLFSDFLMSVHFGLCKTYYLVGRLKRNVKCNIYIYVIHVNLEL